MWQFYNAMHDIYGPTDPDKLLPYNPQLQQRHPPKPKVVETKVEDNNPLTLRTIGKIQDLDQTSPAVYLRMQLKPRIILLYGKPESGKTTLLRAIMKAYDESKYFKFGRWASGSGHTDDLKFLHAEDMIEATKKEVNKYLVTLKEIADAARKQGKIIPNNFLIIEDATGWCGHHTSSTKNPDLLKEIGPIHRHLRLTLIIMGHIRTAMMPALREISQYTFGLQSNSEPHWKGLKSDFGMCLPKKYKVKKEYDELVSKHCQGSRGLLFRSTRAINDVHLFEAQNVLALSFTMRKSVHPYKNEKGEWVFP